MLFNPQKSVVVLICCGMFTTPALAAEYTIDNSHASLIFGVSHFGYSFTYGRFNSIKGSFSFDKNNQTAGNFEVAIDASSIDTNDKKRDQHLSSPDFFDVRQFPTISFTCKSISESEKGLQLTGDLTLHGITRKMTIPLQYLGEGLGPYKNYRCGLILGFLSSGVSLA